MSTIRYGDKGSKVRKLQQALMARGYELPRCGADGDLGEEVWEALQRFAQDRHIEWNPAIPAAVVEALGKPVPTPETYATSGLPDDVELFDLRGEALDPHPKSKTVNGKTVRRAVSSIDSITIHQTAVVFGASASQISAAGGNRKLALARRALTVACHAMAFRDGFLSFAADVRSYIYHGNTLNRRSLGLEIDGNYPGLVGGATNNGKPESAVTDELVAAARAGIKALYDEGRKAGCPIKYIHAHRQSSSTRRADPGEALWRKVVLEYAVPVLGLVPQRGETWGSGRTIPTNWDPEGIGNY